MSSTNKRLQTFGPTSSIIDVQPRFFRPNRWSKEVKTNLIDEAKSMAANTLNTAALLDNPEFSDVQLGGSDGKRRFHCHRIILSSASSALKDQLASQDQKIMIVHSMDSMMLAHILSYVYTGRYPNAKHFPDGTLEWMYHWLIKEAAARWDLADLVKEAGSKCSDGVSMITSVGDAYTAIAWLYGKGDASRCTALLKKFGGMTYRDYDVARQMSKSSIFSIPDPTPPPPLRRSSGIDNLKEMSLIYCTSCRTQAIYEREHTKRMPCSHPDCEYQVHEDQIPCWIRLQDVNEFTPSTRASDRNAESNHRAPLLWRR